MTRPLRMVVKTLVSTTDCTWIGFFEELGLTRIKFIQPYMAYFVTNIPNKKEKLMGNLGRKK